jgi:Fic family protein
MGHELYENEAQKDELEGRNVGLQFDEVVRLLLRSSNARLRLTRRKILRLHRFAIQDIYTCAGRFRDWPVAIRGSQHRPPEPRYVRGLVAEMCATVNREADWPPTKTAAFVLWRLNWIHPFGGGNGRTARAVADYALGVRLGGRLLGKLAIADKIDQNRRRYQEALVDADEAWRSNIPDVSRMQSLLEDMLESQLTSYLGRPSTDPP